jgi:hypothetical protein
MRRNWKFSDAPKKFRFYFADVGFIPRLDHDINFGVTNILNSFAMAGHVWESIDKKNGAGYFSAHTTKKGEVLPERKNPKIQLFLDSGAYTGWNKGVPVNVDDYIDFINCVKWDKKQTEEKYLAQREKHADYEKDEFELIANLDVIPGKPGVPDTPDDLKNAAEEGWANMLYMESKGINVVHIFHQGEDFKWLEKLSEHQEYIGISPNNLATTPEKRLWLDRVFDFLSDGKGGCRNKTHGFGVSSLILMERYPWFSCDSSTWSMGRRTGTIKMFLPGNKSLHGVSIAMSDKVGAGSNKIHYDLLDDEIKKIVIGYCEENEIDLEGMRTSHEARDKANILFFLKEEDHINKLDVKFTKQWGDLF